MCVCVMCNVLPSHQTNSVEDGFSLRSNSRGSQQIATVAEPTTGSSVTRKGVKYTPKLDSVVILSNKMNETSTDFDTPSSYGGQSSAAAEVPPSLPPPRQSRSSKRSLESRPKSESSLLGVLSLSFCTDIIIVCCQVQALKVSFWVHVSV